MATEPGHRQSPDAIKREIAQSRDQVAREFRGLRYELDIPRKIRRSFREKTGLWIGVAVIVGAAVVFLPLRRRTVHVDLASGKKVAPQNKLIQTGFALGLARVALTMLKPTIMRFVMDRMRGPTSTPERSVKW